MEKSVRYAIYILIGIVATILSIYTHTWIPVVLAVLMDISITGTMIELNKE